MSFQDRGNEKHFERNCERKRNNWIGRCINENMKKWPDHGKEVGNKGEEKKAGWNVHNETK